VSSLPEFVSSYWQAKSTGELVIGGVPVSTIVSRYGSPLFAYDRDILERKYWALRSALPERFAICYSMKANPNPEIMTFFLQKKCGLEIASLGEFFQAVHSGFSAKDILFAGPGKTEAELEEVIARGIGEIHAESETELRRISALSQKLCVRTRVAVRVNPGEEGQGGAMQMGGKSAPFGFDEENLEWILHQIVGDPHIEFCGIHLFAGTQILDYELLLKQYRKGIEIARRAAAAINARIRTLDFGGGLGIPYFSGDSELNLAQLGSGLRALTAELETDTYLMETRFVVEPGRFLVGEAGVYVARVNDIKVSRGRKYLILDGGMNHHLAASGNLGQVIKRNFPIALLNRLNEPATETVEVVGPLCTPLDTLGRSVVLPKPKIGDCLGIFQSGAYARSASPLGFLSHSAPPEVWVEEKQDFLVRRRGSWKDYVRDAQPISLELQSGH